MDILETNAQTYPPFTEDTSAIKELQQWRLMEKGKESKREMIKTIFLMIS